MRGELGSRSCSSPAQELGQSQGVMRLEILGIEADALAQHLLGLVVVADPGQVDAGPGVSAGAGVVLQFHEIVVGRFGVVVLLFQPAHFPLLPAAADPQMHHVVQDRVGPGGIVGQSSGFLLIVGSALAVAPGAGQDGQLRRRHLAGEPAGAGDGQEFFRLPVFASGQGNQPQAQGGPGFALRVVEFATEQCFGLVQLFPLQQRRGQLQPHGGEVLR